MPANRAEALKLPDQLLVRYFRGDELDNVTCVRSRDTQQRLTVRLRLADGRERLDHWRDLGGGLGYVPDSGED